MVMIDGMAKRAMFGFLLAATVACGGPLDRRDGALLVQLTNVPDPVDRVRVTVTAQDRVFRAEGPRPPADLVTELTAIPAGHVGLEVQLFAGAEVVAVRSRSGIEVVENDVRTAEVSFAAGPDVQIVTPAELATHAVYDGPIFLELREVVVAEAPVEVHVTVNDGQVEVPPFSAGSWLVMIDPLRAGPVLPAPLRIRVEACYEGTPPACTTHLREVEIHRRVWRQDMGAPSAGGAAVQLDVVVAADRQGSLHHLDLQTGEPRGATWDLGAGAFDPIAVAAGRVAAADEAGVFHRFVLADGAHVPVAVGELSSGVVSDGGRFVLGAGRRLLAFGIEGPSPRELARLPSRIRAPPLADTEGVVAVDLSGRVVSLAPDGTELYFADVGGPVVAPPVRAGAELIVATTDGYLHRISQSGAVGPPIDLRAPVVYAPAVIGEGLVVAAGDQLAWVDGEAVRFVRLGSPITGGPVAWPGEPSTVVVGLRSGVVALVNGVGEVRVVSRLPSAALTPAVFGVAGEVVVVASGGEIMRLRTEEGF